APTSIVFGNVLFGASVSRDLTITNTGGSSVTINRSKPPVGRTFQYDNAVPEGTVVAPGRTITVHLTYTASLLGPQSGAWQLNGTDGAGVRVVSLTGTGVAPDGLGPIHPPDTQWLLGGVASLSSTELLLTGAADSGAPGTAFWPVPVPSKGLAVR